MQKDTRFSAILGNVEWRPASHHADTWDTMVRMVRMVADTWNGKDTSSSLGHSGEMAAGVVRDEMLARQQALCGLLVRQL